MSVEPLIEPLLDIVEPEITPEVEIISTEPIEPEITPEAEIISTDPIEPAIDPVVQSSGDLSLTALQIRDLLQSLTGENRLDISAIKNVSAGGTATQTMTLANLPADTWVDFPAPPNPYTDWQIYYEGTEVSDDFLIQEQNGVMQIRSSVSYTNLEFIYE